MSGESADGPHADAGGEADRILDDRPRPTPLWALLSRWLLGLEAWLRSHGGKKLRAALRAWWGLIAAAGLFLLFGPVINPPMTLDDFLDSVDTATDTWVARDFDADYVIERDAEGRLRAEVTETITAFFPDDVDESGIERVLATQYEGHALEPSGLATSINGAAVEAEVSESADRLTIRLDTGQRLSGDHEFVLRYTLQDLAFSATDDATGQSIDLLDWSVFGPSWPQAFTGLDVSITVPDALADSLIRQPRGSIAWTLVSGGEWLEPEHDSPAGQTTYAFTSDQNMPPNAQAWFTLPFPAGTFTMPPPTPLFILQSFGPLLPLAFLLVTLLFSLAARAVAWSDARGRPWFVAQYDPPSGVSPAMAAQILGTPRTRELAVTLATLREERRVVADRERIVAMGRVAARTGRVGDRVRAASGFRLDPARRRQLPDGYRRIPRGFVRDWFLLAPVALCFVQLGLVRQLSHQTTLAVVWWPPAFVAASLVAAVVIVGIAWTARPLTRKGALAKQHLRGIDVFARSTSLLERSTLTDPLLPYAVLQEDPRNAGRRILTAVEHELGGVGSVGQWRSPDFLSWPRLLVRAAAVLLVVGAVLVVAFAPNPYVRESTVDNWDFEAKGALYTLVNDVDVDAALRRDGVRLRLEATQRAEVTFEDGAPRPPQFAQPWPAELDGQELGFSVERVRVDGDDVPFDVARVGDLVHLSTAMSQVLTGAHTVEVDYTLENPVTAGSGSVVSGAHRAPVERLRWAALLEGWDSGWTYPSAPDVSISLTVPDDIAELATAAGWLRQDPDTAENARDWEDSVFPFGTAEDELGPPDYVEEDRLPEYGEIVETTRAEGDAVTHALRATEGDNRNPTTSTYTDLGVMLEFPTGTFAGPDADAYQEHIAWNAMPIIVVSTTAALSVLIALGALMRAGGHARRTPQGVFRDVVWMLGPAAALASIIVFVWASLDMSEDYPAFLPLLLAAGAALTAAITGVVIIRPDKASVPVSPTPRRKNRRKRRADRRSGLG